MPGQHEYEVELLMHVEADSYEDAVLQAAGNVDDGGGYRLGWRVKNLSTGSHQFIDAETIEDKS